MKQEYVTVVFKSKYGEFSIKLFGRFTCLIGLESGEGKSKLLTDLLDNKYLKDTSVTNDRGLPIAILPKAPDDINAYVKNAILILDEASVSEGYKILDMCIEDMFFVMICRSLPIKNTYPACGIYHLNIVGEWYSVDTHKLRLYTDGIPIDTIVTEAIEDRSENAVVRQYFDNVIDARGRDKILKGIRKARGNTLVLADLCNIGKAYQHWETIPERYPNVYFYDYQSFEQLLYVSPLVQQRCGSASLSPFSCNTLETFYNSLLEKVTYGTELEYHHGEPLPTPYLDTANFNNIFDSDVGRCLMHLLERTHVNNGEFDPIAYLHGEAGDKFKYFTDVQVRNCITQEDCDELLTSLRWLD